MLLTRDFLPTAVIRGSGSAVSGAGSAMSRLPDRQAVFVGATALPADRPPNSPTSMPRRAPPPGGSSLGAWSSHGTVSWRRLRTYA
jgi:hypothetical protein